MWMCDTCGRGGSPGGYRAAVDALEAHLTGSGCTGGWYSYGGRTADRETVTVRLEDGKPRHQRGDGAVAREDAA